MVTGKHGTVNGEVPDEVFEGAVSLLEQMCAISSASGDISGLRQMAFCLGDQLKRRGLVVEIVSESGKDRLSEPVLVARGPAAGVTSSILLVGHLDTVLPAIPPRRQGDRLWGTGALDMKGGFAALIGALDLLHLHGRQPPEELLLVAVPDEEIGGPISARAVRHYGAGARAVLVLEPGERRESSETLVIGRRGLTGWKLEARGQASHSGLAYWQGRSALAAAATWSGAVQRMSESGEGPTVNVGRILGGDAELVDNLGEHHQLIGTNQRLNIVADHCLAEGEVRFLTMADRERIISQMKSLASELSQQAEVSMTLEMREEIAPVNPSRPGRSLAELLVAVAAEHGWQLELELDRGGVSFTNFLPDSSTTVLDGLGPVGEGMHVRDEWLDLGSLRGRIALLAEMLQILQRR
jgi:glutamate carboxypeptidase